MSCSNEKTVLKQILSRSQVGIHVRVRKMRELIILAAVAACCFAAPLLTNEDIKEIILQRPSPINPDVPMEPKPAEKITMITDPKEIAKYKRDTDNKKEHSPVLPTISTQNYHAVVSTERGKHDHEEEQKVDHELDNHRVKRDLKKETEKHDHEHDHRAEHEHNHKDDHEHEHDNHEHRVKRDLRKETEKHDHEQEHKHNAEQEHGHKDDHEHGQHDNHEHRVKRDLRKETEKHDHEHDHKAEHEQEHKHNAEHEHDHKDDGHHDNHEHDRDHIKHRVKRDTVKPNDKHDYTKVQPLNNKPVDHQPATAAKPKNIPPPPPKRTNQQNKNEPTKPEPARYEPIKSIPAKHEPVKPEPAKQEPSRPQIANHRQKRDDVHIASSLTTVTPGSLEHKIENNVPHIDTVVSSSTPHADTSEITHSAQEPQVRPQILPALLPIGAEVNPHSLQAVLTVKRDIPVPLEPKHHHPEESPKDDDSDSESSEEKKTETENNKAEAIEPEENKSHEKKSNYEHKIHAIKRDDVQVEDLSDAVPLQHPKPISLEQQHSHNLAHQQNIQHSFINHEQQTQPHFQPQHPHVAVHQAELAAQEKEAESTSTTTSTEHPVLRHQPVPVAELFARPHKEEKISDE